MLTSLKISVLASAVALAATLTSCASGGGSPAPSSAASSAAPLSQAQLAAGSRHEKGLLIFSNALPRPERCSLGSTPRTPRYQNL